jgi:hypothetical protein
MSNNEKTRADILKKPSGRQVLSRTLGLDTMPKWAKSKWVLLGTAAFFAFALYFQDKVRSVPFFLFVVFPPAFSLSFGSRFFLAQYCSCFS